MYNNFYKTFAQLQGDEAVQIDKKRNYFTWWVNCLPLPLH